MALIKVTTKHNWHSAADLCSDADYHISRTLLSTVEDVNEVIKNKRQQKYKNITIVLYVPGKKHKFQLLACFKIHKIN